MTEAIRQRLHSVHQALPTVEELKTMPKLDQFDRLDTDNLRAFHFGQLKWAIERDYTPIILQIETEDASYDFQHQVSHQEMELEERTALWPQAIYVKAAVVDPRPFIEDSYAEVQLEHDQASIRATCTCEWSREGWEDRRTGHRYPYRTCSHIMTALAAHDPEVVRQYGEREARIASNQQKLDAPANMGISLKQLTGVADAHQHRAATTPTR